MKTKKKWIQGWQIKGSLEWCVAVLSFVVFVLLEAALIYSYLVFVRVL